QTKYWKAASPENRFGKQLLQKIFSEGNPSESLEKLLLQKTRQKAATSESVLESR
ncbi:hypothetical protein TSAR_005932, partial [Trichomalopsis sarcophagae]